MANWLQHLLVLIVVAGAALVVVRQAVATLRRGKGGFGACCAKGCGDETNRPGPSKGPAERVQFIPADSLYRRRG